jgi:succinoglycan biosynthesis transport protein ExoP
MLGGRRKLPVLAEISGPAAGEARAWSLRRADHEALAKPRGLLDGRRVVLVSGDERLAGAVALAAASAAGRRTALVECDMERPRLALELGLASAPGLHEYLRWEATAAEILQPLVLAGPAARGASGPLVCTVGGRAATNASTLIELESFRHALAKLRAAYDLTVLVGLPLEVVRGSPEVIAAQADAVLAAVSPKGLSGQAGRLLRAQLRRLPAETLGAIVVDPD